MMRPAVVLSILVAAGAVMPAACGDGESDRPTVAATTGILADIAAQVAGEDLEVTQVVPDGSSPHDFQLSARDRAELEDAALLVMNGAGLERGIPVDEVSAPRFVLADHAGELLHAPDGAGDDHGDEAEDEQAAGGARDPHVWMDPARVASALPALAKAMGDADPGGRPRYERRARRYARRLRALDAEMRRLLAAVPPDRRRLVTSHDSLGYFADAFGLEVVATPFGATGPEAEPSAAAVRDVVAAIQRESVPAVFAQAGDDPALLERIADQAGAEVVEGLLVESPGQAGSYAEMLRFDADLIARALR